MEGKKLISIGIPAHNEEVLIGPCLASLLAQQAPPNSSFEFIVCANACTDRTAEIVKEISAGDGRVKLIQTSQRGKANAANLITGQSEGSHIVFCDADTLYEPTAVAQLVKALDENPRWHAVSADPEVLLGKRPNLLERFTAAKWKNAPARHAIWGGLYAIRREKMPQFPEGIINEDAWLSIKLGRENFGMLKSVGIRTQMPISLREHLRQRTRWRAGREQLKALGLLPNIAETGGKPRGRKPSEKILNFLLAPHRAYVEWAGKNAYRKGAFSQGWTPPKRRRLNGEK